MEGRYPPAVMVTVSDCTDASREAELNAWYRDVFIPRTEATDFIRNTRRYANVYGDRATFTGRPKYLTVSEVHRTDTAMALRELRQLYTGLRAEEGLEVRKFDSLYERIGPEFQSPRSGRPVKIVYAGFVGCTDSARETEFNHWYDRKHSPDALVASFDTGYRYKAVDLRDPVPHQTMPYLSLYESSKDLDALNKTLDAFREEMIATDPIWVDLLAVYWSGLFSRI